MASLGHLSTDSTEIIELPSGKKAISSRPSLKGLRKFTEIEKIRGEEEERKKNGDKAWNWKNAVKWGITLAAIAAIGGVGYYYIRRKRKGNEE